MRLPCVQHVYCMYGTCNVYHTQGAVHVLNYLSPVLPPRNTLSSGNLFIIMVRGHSKKQMLGTGVQQLKTLRKQTTRGERVIVRPDTAVKETHFAGSSGVQAGHDTGNVIQERYIADDALPAPVKQVRWIVSRSAYNVTCAKDYTDCDEGVVRPTTGQVCSGFAGDRSSDDRAL